MGQFLVIDVVVLDDTDVVIKTLLVVVVGCKLLVVELAGIVELGTVVVVDGRIELVVGGGGTMVVVSATVVVDRAVVLVV